MKVINVVLIFIWIVSPFCFAGQQPEFGETAKNVVAIDFLKNDGSIMHQGTGVIVNNKGTLLVQKDLFLNTLSANVRFKSGHTVAIKGIFAQNKNLKIWKTFIKSAPFTFQTISFSDKIISLNENVFVFDPQTGETKCIAGKVLKSNKTDFLIEFDSNLPVRLKNAPVFNSKLLIMGFLSNSKIKKETKFVWASAVTAPVLFDEGEVLSILDWKFKLEKEWKESTKGMMHAITYHTAKKDYQAAIPLLKKVIKKEPKYASAYARLGFCLGRMDKFEKSVDAYKKAVEFEPNNAKYNYNLGQALAAIGKYKKAVDATEKAISLDPNNQWAHYNLGVVYIAMGKDKKTVKKIEDLKKINPALAKKLADYKEQQSGI